MPRPPHSRPHAGTRLPYLVTSYRSGILTTPHQNKRKRAVTAALLPMCHRETLQVVAFLLLRERKFKSNGGGWNLSFPCLIAEDANTADAVRRRGSKRHQKKPNCLGWCRRGDSNPHGSPHTPLKRACLPISPLRHSAGSSGIDEDTAQKGPHYSRTRRLGFVRLSA